MSLITTLILAGFSNTAHAGSPYINPVSLTDFTEWNLVEKTGSVGSISLEGSVEVPLYTDKDGAPSMKTFVTTENTEEGERGDLFALIPNTSLIVVSEDFAKSNELDIKVTNKRLIPVPDDFKVGGEIKYVTIPSLNVGGMVLNDVTALISGSENKLTSGLTYPHMIIGLGALPTSYAVLHSKGVIKFSDDGAGLMKEVGATGVPYQTRNIQVGTQGKKTLSGANKTLLPGHSLIVEASFNGTATSTAIEFDSSGSSLDRYVEASSTISTYSNDLRLDWMTPSLGEQSLYDGYVSRPVLQPFSDGLNPIATIGHRTLIGYDIVVDKTTETIGMVKHDGFEFTSYYPIHLEDARKALEPKEDTGAEDGEGTEEGGTETSTEPALNVAGINGLISALETGSAYTEALEQYALLIADEDEQTDCQLWFKYGHAQRITGNIEEAHKAYTESARLYHSWWDIDLGRRMDINKAQGKMDEEEIEAAKERSKGADLNSVEDGWYMSQPEACYRADGWVASVDLISGNHEAVSNNYRSNVDLDAQLAQVFGHSELIQGNTERAHEAYRQAIKLENGISERANNRLALALVYADQGKWSQANDLFIESLTLRYNPLNAMLWFDNAVAQNDLATAEKMLQEWITSHPSDVSGIIVQLRNASTALQTLQAAIPEPVDNEETEADAKSEKEAVESEEVVDTVDNSEEIAAATLNLEAAQKAFDTWLQNADRWYAENPKANAALTVLGHTYSGNIEQAGKALDTVKGHIHASPELSFAAANYYAMTGKSEEASNALTQTVTLAPYMSGYALTLIK